MGGGESSGCAGGPAGDTGRKDFLREPLPLAECIAVTKAPEKRRLRTLKTPGPLSPRPWPGAAVCFTLLEEWNWGIKKTPGGEFLINRELC